MVAMAAAREGAAMTSMDEAGGRRRRWRRTLRDWPQDAAYVVECCSVGECCSVAECAAR